MAQRDAQALVAGVAGSVAGAWPACAQAASLFGFLESSTGSDAVVFAAGAAAGAGATLVIGAGVLLWKGRDRDDEFFIEQGAAQTCNAPALELDEDEPTTHVARHMAPAPAEGLDEASAKGARAAHATDDYEQIAVNYAKRRSTTQRIANRAQGVAETLRQRMESSKMSGIPVIERADGSVGDVGTSWWESAVAEEQRPVNDRFMADAALPAVPSGFGVSDKDRLVSAADDAKKSIAERVAFVDDGVYPERRSFEELEAGDDWASALRSLDERIASESAGAFAAVDAPAAFMDTVGGSETLDEPDNIEPKTQFIPFKTPAGHPEVVDTSSYVDYLIASEFDKNASSSARRSSRRFLCVIEGGTSAATKSLSASKTMAKRASAPKHFALPLAAEA